MASYKDDKMTNKAFDLRALKPKLAIIIMMIRNRIEKFFFNSRCPQKLHNETKVFLKFLQVTKFKYVVQMLGSPKSGCPLIGC